jgi:Flp pilus assembly protein TadD
LTEPEDIGFVVCASCGARIKADRGWCLRCHEPLRAFKKPEILPTWLQAIGGGTLVFAVVGVSAIGLIAYLSFDSASTVQATPDRRPTSQVRSAEAAAPVSKQVATHMEPVLFVESSRRGSVDQIADKDLADARTRFEQALQRDPKDSSTVNNLGLVLERLGFVDTAIGRFADAVSLDRRNWVYHFNLAHAMSLRQDWNHAASEYASAIEIFPDNFPAQYNLAVAFHMGGNETQAIKAFERAIEMAPGDPASHLSLAISLDALGRADDAQSEYRQYLRMVPNARDAAAVSVRIQALSHES